MTAEKLEVIRRRAVASDDLADLSQREVQFRWDIDSLLAEIERLRGFPPTVMRSQTNLTVVCAQCGGFILVDDEVERVVNSPVYCARPECIAVNDRGLCT